MVETLNIRATKEAMRANGLNSSELSNKLSVSRQAVSKWLKGEKFPRPKKLLELALLLKLNFEKLVISEPRRNSPVVAFRKRGANITRDHHIIEAEYMGNMLTPLSTYLPFNDFVFPATLRSPKANYNYCQRLARKFRTEAGLKPVSVLNFEDLIDKFNQIQAVLIPVMWGKKDRHENALNIYLPDSMTTWVYLNLDTHLHDFKFWMAHELGHALAPTFNGNDIEDFADEFASALLFPEEVVAKHKNILDLKDESNKLKEVIKLSKKYVISPITVSIQFDKYAKKNGLKKLNLGRSIYPITTNFNKKFKNVSEIFFGEKPPTSKKYIKGVTKEFNTPFFNSLRNYLKDSGKSANYIKAILSISLADAKGIYSELC